MNHPFPKELRLRTSAEFQRTGHQGKRIIGKYLMVDYSVRNTLLTRLGVTVSRRFGKSCHRNKFKRRIRETFRLSYPQLAKGYDLNIRPRTAALTAPFSQIRDEFIHLLRNL